MFYSIYDPENATQIILENKEELLKKDFKVSAKRSGNLAACIALKISWERGQGNKDISKSFFGRCVTQHLVLSVHSMSHVPSTTTCLEYACEEHPVQMQDLSRDSLIETLAEGQADSIFLICSKLSNSKSMWNYFLYNIYIKLYMFTLPLYHICPLGSLS